MPQKQEFATVTGQGEPEQVRVISLSELLTELVESGELVLGEDSFELGPDTDMIVLAIPDTGTAKFIPSGESKPDRDGKTKATKACFIVAEMGGWQAGEGIGYRQTKGDVARLPCTVRLSIVAQVPNNKGRTIDEALNRNRQLVEVPQTDVKAA